MKIDPQTQQFIVQVLTAVLGTAATVFASIVGALPVILPLLWPILSPLVRTVLLRNRGAKAAAAFDALENALKPALSVAMQELKNGVAAAKKPNSPGGEQINTEEYQALVARAVDVAWRVLDKQGLLRDVVDSMGGEEALRASMAELLERGLSQKHNVERPIGTVLGAAQ